MEDDLKSIHHKELGNHAQFHALLRYDEAHAMIDGMKQGDWSQMSPAEKAQVRAHYLKYNH